MNGDDETGITIIKMSPKMDAGNILKVGKLQIPDYMNFGELRGKLCDLASDLIMDVFKNLESGPLKEISQDSSQITLAHKISKDEETINFNLSAIVIHNLVRALSPIPGAWCMVEMKNERKRMKIKNTTTLSSWMSNTNLITR